MMALATLTALTSSVPDRFYAAPVPQYLNDMDCFWSHAQRILRTRSHQYPCICLANTTLAVPSIFCVTVQ